MRKRHRLGIKFIISFSLLAILICCVSAGIGYSQFEKSIKKKYNEDVYCIAEVAKQFITSSNLKLTELDKVFSSERTAYEYKKMLGLEEYENLIANLLLFRDAMKANDIFLVRVDEDVMDNYQKTSLSWTPLTYIFDIEQRLDIGQKGPFNPKFIPIAKKALHREDTKNDYIISKSIYGYNISAIVPIELTNETLILCTEINMIFIQKTLSDFFQKAILVSILVITIVVTFYMLYFFKTLIRPLQLITKATMKFIENVDCVSEELFCIKTKDEIESLAKSILTMQLDIKHYIYNITKITKDRERIDTELNIAKQIQLSMLPSIACLNEQNYFDLAAKMTPAKEVGGDFYDYFMVDSSHLAVVIADVSGKGIPAALFMTIGKILIKEHTNLTKDLSVTFQEVNSLLYNSNSEGLFITAFEGILDLKTGQFIYVNAGHEPPFIYRKNKLFELYPIEPDFVLAGLEEIEYKYGIIQLEVGDKFFEYTDGVTEATNIKHELYGMKRLQSTLSSCVLCSPQEILKNVQNSIDEFVGEQDQFDDITMLCFEFKEKLNEKSN